MDQTYIVALIETKLEHFAEVPKKVARFILEFFYTMPPELLKELPLRYAINHKIELEPGTKPLAKALHHMVPSELVKLRKQLDELLSARLI